MTTFIYIGIENGYHTVVEVTMDHPDDCLEMEYWQAYCVSYDLHVKSAPRLPILGTVPYHWKEGEVIPEGEYKVQHQKQAFYQEWTDCVQFTYEHENFTCLKRKVIIPFTTK